MVQEKKRHYWLDLLKILACFLVVVNHTGGYLLGYAGTNDLGTSLFYMIGFVLCKIGVPLFIMITGFLLLKRESSFKDMGKKIFRIFVPLFLLSALVYFKANGFDITKVGDFLLQFISDPLMVPFWYLYMLIGLYLVTPFLQKMVDKFKTKDYLYFIIICLIIPSMLPVISAYLPVHFSSNFTVALLPIYVGYYVSGLYLSKLPLTKKYRNMAIICAIVFFGAFLASMLIPYLNSEGIIYTLDSCSYITIVIPSLSIFYLFRYYFENKIFKGKTSQIITTISSVTFGIYLFHIFINYKIYDLGIIQNIFGFNALIGIVLVEVLTFIVAGIITYILKKIKFVKNFL